jgi:hypothetical protein
MKVSRADVGERELYRWWGGGECTLKCL